MEAIKEWLFDHNNWLSLVSSLCTIIAFPITIFQLVSVKSKIKATEKGIQEILSVKEHEKLEEVLAEIKIQHSGLMKLQMQISEPGGSKKTIDDKMESIVEGLSRSMCDMPIKEEEISNSIRVAIDNIRQYRHGEDKLKDAEAYIYSSIQGLKRRIEDYRKLEIENAKQ